MMTLTLAYKAVRTVARGGLRLKLGLILLLLIVLLASLHGPIIWAIGHGTDPRAIGFADKWLNPSADHWLGTDQEGRDNLALVLTGLWTSLQIGALAGVLATTIAVAVAFFAAYKGGLADAGLSSVTDLFMVIPSLPLLIAYAGFAKHIGLLQVGTILAVFSWPGAARAIRSHVLSLRQRAYVDLAKMTNESDLEIITTELLPNMLPFIALGLAQAAIGAILGLVSLELIGLGPSGVTDLGLLINNAIMAGALSAGAWPTFVAPIFIIALLFFALNLINIGLEEVYNPRLRSVAGE